MADAEKDALAQSAAGLDLTRTPTSAMASDPTLAGHINTANAVAAMQRQERANNYSTLDLTKDVLADLPSVTVYGGMQGALGYETDANFTWDQFKPKFDEAKKLLPEEYWSQLYGARSSDHFDFLLARSLSHVERSKRIAEAGWDGTAASFLSQVVDPMTWTSWGVSVRALRAMQATSKGWVASHALSGAWANGALTAIEHASGKAKDESDYLAATGMGLILGGTFGALSRNPATAGEAAVLVKVGKDLWKAGVSATELATAKASSLAGIKRAAEAAKPEVKTIDVVAPEVRPEPVAGAPEIRPEPAVVQPSEKVGQPAEPAAPVRDPHFDDAVTTGQPAKMDDPPQLLKNTNYYGRYAAPDGLEYRVYRSDDGEFRVVQVNPEKGGRNVTIASGLEKASDALAKIPTAEPKPPAGMAASIQGVPGRVPGRGEAQKVGDDYIYRSHHVIRDLEETRPGYKHFTAHKEDGTWVGETELQLEPDGRWKVAWMKVDEAHEKSWAATAMFKAAEAEGAHVGIPDGTLSNDGTRQASFPMWAKRLWWVKEWYRPDPIGGTDMLSPKRLLQNLEGLRATKKSPKVEEQIKAHEAALKTIPKEAFDPENMATMFASKQDPMHGLIMKGLAREAALDALDRILPGFKARVMDTLGDTGSGLQYAGLYDSVGRVIWLSMRSHNIKGTAYHEAVHAMKDLGLFTPAEWAKLESKVNSRALKKLRDTVDANYKGENLTPGQRMEEYVAHLIEARATGKTFGAADAVLEKIIHLLRQIRDGMGLKGFHSAQDVFDDLNAGVIGSRPEDPSFGSAFREAASINAADNPIPRQDYLQDPDWKAVQEGDVAYTAGRYRFDPAYLFGKSKSAATRLLGSFLLDDVVGKQGHALNNFSADIRKAKIFDQYTGQFNRFREGLLQEWADAEKIGPIERRVRQSEFYTQTGLYIRGVLSPDEVHPAVKKFGDATRGLLNEVREDFNNPLRHEGKEGRPLTKSGDMAENEKYLARMFNHEAVRDAIETYGTTGVERMVAGAIRKAQPDIDDAVLQKLAHGYVVNIDKRARGLADGWDVALGTGDRAKLAAALREDIAHITDQEIDYVLARVMPEGGTNNTGHLKNRILLDEGHIERGDDGKGLPINTNGVPNGAKMPLAFHALLQNDVTKVMDRYLARASGWLSLAQTRVQLPETPGFRTAPDGTQTPHPTPGHVVVDGFTSHQEIDDAIQRVKEYGTDLNRRDPSYTLEQRDKEIEALRWHFDRILGIPNPKQLGEPAWWMRMLRGLQTMRLLGQVGIAQVGETGTAVGTLGLRAAAGHMPAYKRIITSEGESVLAKPMYRFLEAIGIGTERLHGLRHHGIENIEEVPFGTSKSSWKDLMQDTVKVGERATYELSGMSFVQQQQERAVAAWIAQDWATQAFRMQQGKAPDGGWIRRAAQLGISEPMMQRIFKDMSEHVSLKESYHFQDRIESLNAHLWTDLEAKAHFENGLYRYVRKIIQKGSQGSVPRWMQEDPLMQTIFQFRTFPFTAWANQFQYGMHMMDHRTFQAFTWSLVWNSLVRYAQVQALAVGRVDRDKYLQEKLSWRELAAAGFSRSGWSSIMPMAIDTGLLVGGNREGIFNQRSSGQSSNIIFGSPTLSFYDTATKGIGGLANSAWNMRSPSQGELRNAFNILPFSNLMPIAQGYNYMISGRPEKAPSKKTSPGFIPPEK